MLPEGQGGHDGSKDQGTKTGLGCVVVFLNYKSNRLARCAGSEKAAIAAKEFLESQIATGTYVPPPRKEPKKSAEVIASLAEYYKTFERVYLTTACRASTQGRYADCFDKYILPRFGANPLPEISRTAVKEFAADLVGRGLARATIRIIISNLCTVLSHVIEDNLLTANPATRMPKYFKQAKVTHDKIQSLTLAEVQAFLAAAAKHDGLKRYRDVPEYFALFLCAIHTGMRAGELAGLQWGDVDRHGKFIMVRRSIKDGRINPTKTGKMRKIDMSDCLISELEGLKRRRRELWLKLGRNELPEWVFCNSDGEFLDMANVAKRHFHKCLEAAKLRQIWFHDTRSPHS